MLELSHIRKTFTAGVDSVRVFEDFSLSLDAGCFLSVVGSNGSGKTTMLNLICGSVLPDAGRVFLDGRDVTALPEYRRFARVGRVYQDPSAGTVADMTVAENLALAHNKGRRYGLTRALPPSALAAMREEVAGLGVGLEDRMQVPVGRLSGGQRQALALLMATCTPIDLLVLDEHTAALDPKNAELLMKITDRIVREKRLTAVMVTHNLRYAVEYGDRLLMLDRGGIVLDARGEEKARLTTDDLLPLFGRISIECGN